MKRHYKPELTIEINDKGVIDIDTVKGCTMGIRNNPDGCWGLCYAKKIADYRGIEFGVSVSRLPTKQSLRDICKTVRNSPLPFVRIGTMGDPCHDWGLTVMLCRYLSQLKPVVIITKHWIPISDEQMEKLGKLGVIINTSISALDTSAQIKYRLEQY